MDIGDDDAIILAIPGVDDYTQRMLYAHHIPAHPLRAKTELDAEEDGAVGAVGAVGGAGGAGAVGCGTSIDQDRESTVAPGHNLERCWLRGHKRGAMRYPREKDFGREYQAYALSPRPWCWNSGVAGEAQPVFEDQGTPDRPFVLYANGQKPGRGPPHTCFSQGGGAGTAGLTKAIYRATHMYAPPLTAEDTYRARNKVAKAASLSVPVYRHLDAVLAPADAWEAHWEVTEAGVAPGRRESPIMKKDIEALLRFARYVGMAEGTLAAMKPRVITRERITLLVEEIKRRIRLYWIRYPDGDGWMVVPKGLENMEDRNTMKVLRETAMEDQVAMLNCLLPPRNGEYANPSCIHGGLVSRDVSRVNDAIASAAYPVHGVAVISGHTDKARLLLLDVLSNREVLLRNISYVLGETMHTDANDFVDATQLNDPDPRPGHPNLVSEARKRHLDEVYAARSLEIVGDAMGLAFVQNHAEGDDPDSMISDAHLQEARVELRKLWDFTKLCIQLTLCTFVPEIVAFFRKQIVWEILKRSEDTGHQPRSSLTHFQTPLRFCQGFRPAIFYFCCLVKTSTDFDDSKDFSRIEPESVRAWFKWSLLREKAEQRINELDGDAIPPPADLAALGDLEERRSSVRSRAIAACYILNLAPRRPMDFQCMKAIEIEDNARADLERYSLGLVPSPVASNMAFPRVNLGVVPGHPGGHVGNADVNYLVFENGCEPLYFIFNKYKTHRIYNQQIFKIIDPHLKKILKWHLQYNPALCDSMEYIFATPEHPLVPPERFSHDIIEALKRLVRVAGIPDPEHFTCDRLREIFATTCNRVAKDVVITQPGNIISRADFHLCIRESALHGPDVTWVIQDDAHRSRISAHTFSTEQLSYVKDVTAMGDPIPRGLASKNRLILNRQKLMANMSEDVDNGLLELDGNFPNILNGHRPFFREATMENISAALTAMLALPYDPMTDPLRLNAAFNAHRAFFNIMDWNHQNVY